MYIRLPQYRAALAIWMKVTSAQPAAVLYHGYTQKLDNGYIRFTIEYTATKDLSPAMFNPPNGDQFMLLGTATSGERESQSFDVKEELVRATQEITVNFSGGEKNLFFVFVSTSGL